MKSLSRSGIVLLLAAGALMLYGNRKEPPCSACYTAAVLVASGPMVQTAEPCAHCVTAKAEGDTLPARRHEAWQEPVSEPAFAEFKEWTGRYVAAEPDHRTALEAEGVRLATTRRRAMADMITAQPQRALALTVPYGVRKVLPETITALLEEPVNARAEYQVMAARPVDGGEDAVTPVVREAVIGGVRHAVYTFGPALDYVSKASVPVNGVSLPADAATNPPNALNGAPERLLALDPSPARALDDDEAADFLNAQDTPVCPESGKAVSVNNTPGVVEIGGELHAFCGGEHLRHWAASEIDGAGLDTPDGVVAAAGGEVAASGYTEGHKRFLFLRPRFLDSSGAESDTIPQGTAESLLAGMVSHMAEISYDRLKIAPLGATGSAITTPLALSQNAAYYNDAGLSRLYPDARNAAAAAGYNLNDYQFFAVFTRGRPSAGYAGLAYVGGIGIHIANGYWGRNVLVHELGHNLGLPHAHRWDTGTNSIIGDGSNVEYGNGYDPIGSGGDSDHYVGSYKRYLDWIPGADGDPVTTAGTYRLYAMDNNFGNQGLRTLRVSRSGSQDYSFDFRGDRGEAEFQNGLYTHFCNKNGLQSYLLDCTPRQNNIAQPIGRTFTDPSAGVHVTPLRITSTFPESMDVAVHFNVAGNRAPRATVTCHSPQTPANAEVLFTANASDADGDELAYSWDFGDGTFSMNNAAEQSHAFTADGEYAVQCTVSDLNGGTYRRTVAVQVGAPVAGQFQVTGRVVDASNKPLSGIRVYTDDTHYCWTDTDGSYFLARIPAGSRSIKAKEMVQNVLGFSRVFPDPLPLSAHYSGADFSISSAPPETLTNLVPKLATWKYNDTGTDLGTTWRTAGYSDAAWASGPGMLGYGNTGEGTVVSYGGDANNKRTTCYFRKTFTVTNLSAFEELRLHCKRDDMVLVYLNGTRIFADNVPDNVAPDNVVYSTKAKDSVEPNDYLVELNLNPSLLINGTNLLAAEVHQVEPTSSDLAFDAALIGVAQAPGTGAAAAYLTSPADGGFFSAPLAELPLTATARATAATVTKIEFYADNVRLGEDTAAPWQWTWTSPAAGTHALHTVTTFSAGSPLTSGTVNITVSAPPAVLIDAGGAWKYFASNGAAPPANWNSIAYTDAWPSGIAEFGYGDADETTALTGGPYPNTYFRRFFHVSDPAAITGLLARMIRDDAATVYLNGNLVWRSNFELTSNVWTPQGAGADAVENAWHTQQLDAALLRPGSNLLAVEVQQSSPTSSDLSFDFALEGTGPAPRAAGVYLTVPAEVMRPSAALLEAEPVLPAGREVTKVEFFHAGTKLGEDAAWPYEFTWANPPAGLNTVTVRMTDNAGTTYDSAVRSLVVSQPAQSTALVSFGESWRYIDTGIDPGPNWVGRTSYDDTAWPSGNGRLGYGGDGEATALDPGNPAARPVTVWFRRKFNVADPAAFSSLRLRILRDDGVSVQINRVELVRDNLPEGTLSFATLATASIGNAAEQTPVEFIVPTTALSAGENQLAVEVHQSSATSSDLSFDMALYGLHSPTTTAPSVWLTSPASGERLHPGFGLALAVGFSGAPAVQRVEYYAGTAKIGEGLASPWNFTWTVPLNGSYTVKARAILTGGGTLDSPAIPVTISAPDLTVMLVTQGADWKYLDTGVAPAASWQGAAYNDTSWLSGQARLGFGGDGEVTTMTAGHLVYWARKQFTVPAGTTPVSAVMRVQRDDGLAIYLDGSRIVKFNLDDEPVTNTSAAELSITGAEETEWLNVTVPLSALTPGTHQLAVSIHQQSTGSSDTGFDMLFTAVFRPAVGLYNTAPAVPPPLRLAARAGTGASIFDLAFTDQAGRVYVIEKSASLQSWTPVSTHIMTGTVLTLPLTRGPEPKLYYRARWSAAP